MKNNKKKNVENFNDFAFNQGIQIEMRKVVLKLYVGSFIQIITFKVHILISINMNLAQISNQETRRKVASFMNDGKHKKKVRAQK